MQLTIGSRALNLSTKRRKEIASYMRWVRSLRQYIGARDGIAAAEFMNARKINEREVLADMLAKGEAEPAPRLWTENMSDYGQRIERTEAERYEDRVTERECHTRNALRQMASYRHGGL